MAMSSSTASGRRRSQVRSASRPVAASPTTSLPGTDQQVVQALAGQRFVVGDQRIFDHGRDRQAEVDRIVAAARVHGHPRARAERMG
jgi:hypothetical protein